MENQKINELKTKFNELKAKRMALMALVLALGGSSALTGCSNTQTVESETTKQERTIEETPEEIDETFEIKKVYEEVNEENLEEVLDSLLIPNYRTSEYKILDFDMSTATKLQEKFLNKLAGTITKFNEKTHKENNFRISEDGEYYLDLFLPELVCFDLVMNDYSQEELNQLLGTTTLNKEELNIGLENMYFTLMVYYMTAKEPSGISEFIKDEDKKALFERIEEKVLNLNKDYSEENKEDFLSEEIVQAVFKQDKETLEKMDFETLLSTVPVMAVAQRRFADHLESRDITIAVIDSMHTVTAETTTRIANAMPEVEEYYYDLIDKSNKIIEQKDEEKEVKKLKKELEEKFEAAYGEELKKYISGEELDEYLTNAYMNEIYESNLGTPLSSIYDAIEYDRLENYSYINGYRDDFAELHRIRLDLLNKELYNQNENELEEKGLEPQAKVKSLKKHI